MKNYILIPILCILIFFSCARKKQIDFGYVTFYYGNIDIIKSGEKIKPKLKMLLESGDKISTSQHARIDVQLENYGLIRINQNSEVELDKIFDTVNQKVNVKMESGRILCKLKKLDKASEFNVETPTAVAGVRGTTFLVDSKEDKKNSEIAVDEGQLEVTSKNEPEKKSIVNPNETAKIEKKIGGFKIRKGIDFEKLKELKAIKEVKLLLHDLKDVEVDELKDMSFKNLKSLKIKDIKGLGDEFKSYRPFHKNSKVSSTIDKTKTDTEKKAEIPK